MAEHEAKAISTRMKDALASTKAFYSKLTNDAKAELRAKAKATQLGGDCGNLPAVAKTGAKASVAARITRADSHASGPAPIMEEQKAAGAVSLRQISHHRLSGDCG